MSPQEIPKRPTWTAEQAEQLHALRTVFSGVTLPYGSAPMIDERVSAALDGLSYGVHSSSVLIPVSSKMPEVLLDTPVQPQPVLAFWYTAAADIGQPTKVILWVHGGGNILGSPIDDEHRALLSYLAMLLGANYTILAPSYRLATMNENVFPAGLQDIFSAYAYLLDKGFAGEDICIVGTSSGGNAVVVLTKLLLDTRLIIPARLVAIAPAVDSTCNFGRVGEEVEEYDVLPVAVYRKAIAQWLGSSGHWTASNPLVSAVFIESFGSDWPPTLLICGGADKLVGVVRTLARKIEESGASLKYHELEDMPHSFWAISVFPHQTEWMWKLVVEFLI